MSFEAIPYVKVIRRDTRMPVADPERISNEFVEAIRSSQKAVYVAVHCNHPRELTPQVRAACARLIEAGIPLLSQSVLLAGVNDDIETLEQLMRGPSKRASSPTTRTTPISPRHIALPYHDRTGAGAGAPAARPRLGPRATAATSSTFSGGVSKALASPADVETEDGRTRLRGRDGDWRDYQGRT